MPINLKPPTAKDFLPNSNPIQSFQNPVDDFLAPFKQTKNELEGKISAMAQGNTPKSLPEINESNWGDFQGTDPSLPNYQPQSLIDYFRTGKTTSQMMADGSIPSTTIPDSQNPLKNTAKSSNPYEGAPQFVQDFGNFYFGTNPEDPTTSGLYQTLAPHEDTLQNLSQFTQDTAKNMQSVGGDISNVTNELGNMLQNKAPGMDEAKARGEYLTKDQVIDFMDKNPGMSEDDVVKAMSDLEKEGYFFEGYNDINSQGLATAEEYVPYLKTGLDLLGGGSKTVGQIAGGATSGIGSAMEGAGNIASLEGNSSLGSSQMVKGAGDLSTGIITTLYAPLSTVLNTKTIQDSFVGKSMEWIGEKVGELADKTLDEAGVDKNSPQYANYKQGMTQLAMNHLLPIIQEGGGKLLKTGAPYIEKGLSNTIDFVGEKAPKVVDSLGNTATKIGETAGKVKDTITDTYDRAVSGLSKSEKEGMQSNPFQSQEFEKMVEQTKSPEGIDDIKNYQTERFVDVTKELTKAIDDMESTKGEDAQVYNDVKNLDTKIEAKPLISDFEKVLTDNGMEIKDGHVQLMETTDVGTISSSDVSHIDKIYRGIVGDAAKQEGTLNVKQTLKTRKTLSKYARYDKMDANTLSEDGSRVMKTLRSIVDTHAKDNITGLRELDKHFADQLEEFKNSTRDLVYKGGDLKGEYRSNIGSIISNLDKPSRAQLLERLEEVKPGIGKQIEAIRNLRKLHEAYTSKGTLEKYRGMAGFVTGAMAGGQFMPVIGHILGGLAGAAMGVFVDGALTAQKASALRRIFQEMTPQKVEKIRDILMRIKKNQDISKEQEAMIEKIRSKVNDQKIRDTYATHKKTPPLLPEPSGKATGARNFRANQGFDESPKDNGVGKEITDKSIIKRPGGDIKTKNPVIEMKAALGNDKGRVGEKASKKSLNK